MSVLTRQASPEIVESTPFEGDRALEQFLSRRRNTGSFAQTTLSALSVAAAGAAGVSAGETFEGAWPFEACFSDAPGFRMHYVDEGAGPETLLLLHGQPTWGFLFRKPIAAWSAHHRVIAPDMMGFGKSETPQHRSYRLQDHVDNLERFVLDLDLRGLTLVMHGFGGLVGMGLATRQPDRIRRIVALNAPTPLGQPDLAERFAANAAASPWFQWVSAAHAADALRPLLGHIAYNILSALKLNGFSRNELITDAWLGAYRAPFPTPDQALGPIGWAEGFATGEHRIEHPDEAVRALLGAKPALAIWGAADRTLAAEHFVPLFEAAFPGAAVRLLELAGHYTPEDAPNDVIRLVDGFVARSTERA